MTDTVQNQIKAHCNLGYSDELLKYLGDHLNQNWRKLGINLGIASFALDRLHQVKYTHEMALEVLFHWWASTTTHSRWGELHYALASVHRHDLLRQAQKFCKEHSMDYNNPDQSLIDTMFLPIAEGLAVKWKEFGIFLGVDTDKIREIGQQPLVDTSLHAFNVLKMWQGKPESSHHQLIRILADHMNRADLVRYICTQYEKPRQGRVVCDCSTCD